MNNVNGIMLVILSMAAFSVEDMFIKRLSVFASAGQIILVLGLVCTLVFLAWAVVAKNQIFSAAAWGPLPLLRSAAEGIGVLTYIYALSLADLSTVAAVFQALPLTVTLGAAVFLREQVGWRRWCAIGVGFVGVLMIIQPGTEGFQPEVLLVVITVIAVAARDLITRRIDARVASMVVALQANLVYILAGGVLMLASNEPFIAIETSMIGAYAGAVAFAVLAYYTIIYAMRIGEASALTPFRYTRLLFSLLIGVLVLGERPELLMLVGAGLIMASGLYM
ncbi:MAG: DMT family transporter, partial [Ruegeria sp.]